MTMKRLAYGALLLAVSLLAGCGSSVVEKSTTRDVDVQLVAASKDFPNADLLVTPESVQANLNKSGLVIIDARGAGYDTAHVPGAISMQHSDFWERGKGLKDTATLEGLLGKAGLTRDSKIVIYDNTSASWGAAGRIFWMLEYLGCTDVHIMNGGWDKWIADGRPVEAAKNTLPEKKFTAQVKSSVRATAAHIRDRYRDSDFAIIDARTDEEFIGWQLYGEARGGHIPNAVQIPYAWYYATDKTVLNYADMKTLLESRGITRDKEVTSHCTVGIRSGYVYFILRLMGYGKASNYDASIVEWSADANLPMEKLPNYQMIVDAAWIKNLISGSNPQTYPGHGYVILDASSSKGADNMDDYNKGHIPGALYLNIYRLEGGFPTYPYTQPSDGNLLPDAKLQTFIEQLGITHKTTVVIYSKTKAASQPFRVAWALLYAGVEDVRILNGGWDAWTDNGGTVETKVNTAMPASFGISVPAHPEYTVSTAGMNTMRLDPGSALGDMRAWQEFIGETNPYLHNGFTAKGRIPGAIWIDQPGWYFDGDGTLRSYTEVEKTWRDKGIIPGKKIAFYCGTGWRSSVGFMYGYLMGFPKISNYDSGFYGWSFENNPMDTGSPKLR